MVCMIAGRAEAQPRPSSAVLLPYFEVDLNGSGKTTLLAVGNVLDQPVEISIEVRTNWGIVVASLTERLEAHQIASFNLRDWIVQGKLPNRTLRTAERAQIRATLSGQRTPDDGLFYSTQVAANLAVGSVLIRTQPQSVNALWGDFLLVDASQKVSMGDDLVNIDPAVDCPGTPCAEHALRFISGATLDVETQVVIWTDRAVEPSKNPFPESQKVAVDGIAYDESGQPIADVHLRLLPLQVVAVGSLGLKEPFGWLDLKSEQPTFIGIQFDNSRRDGAALQAYCIPPRTTKPGPGIEIEKRTNSEDADLAPGPHIPVGAAVTWEYIVRNTGSVQLTNIKVTDDDPSIQVSCPKDVMDPGDTMVCTAQGTALACQYQNIGTVTATPADDGPQVSAADSSHYFGGDQSNAQIDIEVAVNGQDADATPGPEIEEGGPLVWTYTVTNTGDVALSGIVVSDDKGVAVSCPKDSLAPGESMACTANGVATLGAYENIGVATGKSPCGPEAKDSDPSHHTGVRNPPGLKIEKLTNGQHNTQAPGSSIAVGSPITWSYIVTNTGKVTLSNVQVTDDKVSPITCPKTTLAPGESMTCTANGVAAACQHMNTATAAGTPPKGPNLSDQDWGFYFGQAHPAIDIEKFTNGEDADAAPGPNIPAGNPVNWTYVVTNIGDVPLSGIVVTDSKGVAVSCPKASLQKNESMTCTGNGIANAGPYENLGTVTGNPPCGSPVSDSDPSHYFGTGNPGLKIQKLTNGQHDTQGPGASLAVGSTVTWSYIVMNTGQVALSGITVTDDKVGAIACPKTTLQPGESMTCTANGTVGACQYVNTGTAVGTPPSGPDVTVQDWGFYFGQPHAALTLEKLTNGQDGPTLMEGAPVQWTYKVTNTGDVPLTGIAVTDDKGVAVTCPKTSLQKNESMTCTGSGMAIVGEYHNLGTATGNPPCGSPVSASDPSWYTGKSERAAIDIEKYTNGEDADFPTGPKIPVGNPVLWTYIVTNTGEVALSNVKVTDNKGVAVSCPKTTLQPGESMTCTGNGTATAGQYANIGTAVGKPPTGSNVTDTDPSHYFGEQTGGGQGCTPGYWKNHPDSWPPTGYSPSQTVKSVFAQAASYPSLGNATLLNALSFDGGSTLEGAAANLLRAAVAALLDASHPGVDYPRTPASVISDVNAALASNNRDTMLSLASQLDADNNLGCPLN
jgi:hypothetical protein